ncbi:uncharacterized protein SEPMUDRAFT_150064 [Sphaerulina musiva SO2202]|uniref:Uncharacterized protein n=1 Tax=Sphaerulina musiva (strain SO2202) TaxID=692275 RepID=M3D0I5_SPHMS|nr:uncharacterized protein SEPMUDRAFT_150064 [Sphaerulina musiva SO2202]EMF11033.1 hypothetical protein SEPMUDRAFT_150064 [Sphaerulina musiva SO2202]
MIELSRKKRSRADSESDQFRADDVPFGKRARATTEASADSGKWFNDSVLSTPTRARDPAGYDSDADTSSVKSEPGSPPDIYMDDDMDMDMDDGTFSQSPEEEPLPRARAATSAVLGQRLQVNRVPTPMVPMRPGASPDRVRTGFKQHVRRRHQQEFSASSDLLEVPSPIDEDEVPTPPSAAEAAGSQLSMLSVSDVDMAENDATVPRISIHPARPNLTHTGPNAELDSAIDSEPMEWGSNHIIVRKQRQRSGALSSGNSPVRTTPAATSNKRGGFSMGFRADCEKCRLRVPGHMNHFIA